MKTCKKCNQDYEGKVCKPCKAAYMRQWNAKNPESAKKIRKKNTKKIKKKTWPQVKNGPKIIAKDRMQ